MADWQCWLQQEKASCVEADATQWRRRARLVGLEAPCRPEGGAYFKVQCGQGMSNGELNDMAYLPTYLPEEGS